MTTPSLLRLSRAYERGMIDKASYRAQRSELITALLSEDVDEATATATRRKIEAALDDTARNPRTRSGARAMPRPDPDPTPVAGAAVPAGTPSRTVMLAGAAAVLLVAIVAVVALSPDEDEDEPLPAPQVSATPLPPAPSNLDVLMSYTEEVLADGEVTDDEKSKVFRLLEISDRNDHDAWKSRMDERYVAAGTNGNDALVDLLDDLYFYLDLDTPDDPEAVSPPPAATETVVVTPATPGPAATVEPTDAKKADRPVLQQGSTALAETQHGMTAGAVADPVTEPELWTPAPPPARTVPDGEVAAAGSHAETPGNPASRPPHVEVATVEPPPAVVLNEVEAPAPLRAIPVSPEPVAATLLPNAGENIDAQARSIERSGADINAALMRLDRDGLTLDSVTGFNNALAQATRAEKLALTFTADPATVNDIYAAVLEEMDRYSRDRLELDERYNALARASKALRSLNRSVEKNHESSLAGVDDDGRMSATALMTRDGSRFTLQLLGSSSEKGVQDYIASHDALNDLYYVETDNEGEPWFVVMQGDYESKEIALLVYEQFPADVRQERRNAWARSLASVQQLVAR